MELLEAINTRHSVRKYTNEVIDKETINQLINVATKAPSAMNGQPWAFSVIQDKALLKDISDATKEYILGAMDSNPMLERYRTVFNNPEYDIFHNASTLLTIYAKPGGLHPDIDCSLAAQNVMLTSHALGLGTCWIGFAQVFLNVPNMKEKLNIPKNYAIIAPIIIGHPATSAKPAPKKEAEILFWK